MKNKLYIIALIVGAMFIAGCATSNQKVNTYSQKSIDMEYANPQKGQKIYNKLIYKECGITCNQMAKKYTQDEWEQFQIEGQTMEVISDICPIVKEFNPKEIRVIYDYMYYHASDSGHVAECRD